MRSVIYKIGTFEIVEVVDDETLSIVNLKDNEDFMPVDMWNESTDKEKFPTIE